MTTIVDEIVDLFERYGQGRYGEGLSLGDHMLQSARWAELLGASAPVVVAALLHDIGYFLHPGAETSLDEGRDFEHEALGAAWLSRAFGEDVTAPVALHVQAKRYLCAVKPGYFDDLSAASKLSLSLQGGVMSDGETKAFEAGPAFETAILLRLCDDRGKDPAMGVRTIESYRELMTECLRTPA